MTPIYDVLGLRLIGVAPLLMRSGKLADPLDEHAVALHKVTKKRMKTKSDHDLIARIEWRGSLWLREGRPCIPAEAVEAALVSSAKSRRAGSLVRASVFVRDSPHLVYDGPTEIDDLYRTGGFVHRCGVRVQNARTMRTRPRFDAWSVDVAVCFISSMIGAQDLLEIAGYAGAVVGLGDHRPRFGRFRVELVG